MMRTTMAVLTLAVLATACAAQKVSIAVADMPLPEVVKLLTDMTGVQIVGDVQAPGNAPPITLDLTDVPLKTVIREVCRQSGRHFARFGGRGYSLMAGAREDKRPRCDTGAYQVVLESISINRTLSLSFAAQDPKTTLDHRLSLQLTCESDDDDLMATVCAFDPNVTAVTDTGAELASLQKELWPQINQWEPLVRGSPALQPPPPEATRIARLEGDLILYATVRRAEFGFAPQDVGATKEAQGLSVKLIAFDLKTGQVQCELTAPKETEEGSRLLRGMTVQPTVTVSLLDAEGKAASTAGGGSSGGPDGDVQRYTQQYGFRFDEGFVPAKLIYRVAAASDPTERLTYVLEDIALPREESIEAAPIEQLP